LSIGVVNRQVALSLSEQSQSFRQLERGGNKFKTIPKMRNHQLDAKIVYQLYALLARLIRCPIFKVI